MLYPLKFKSIYKSKVWGSSKIKEIKNDRNIPDKCGESWEISGVEGDTSVITNGFLAGSSLEEAIEIYMGEIVGDRVFEKFSHEFPLLVKIISAEENLSLQVHPNNEVAAKRHNAWGKTEIWYVLEAEDNAKLVSGFSKNTDSKTLLSAIENNDLSNIVNEFPAKSGDVFFIPAGRLHSLGKGATVVEIQQTSDVTYRVYDYGRTDRELHIDLAIDVIDYKKTDEVKTQYSHNPDKSNEIIRTEFFTMNFLPVMNILSKDYYELDSFVIYYCINGKLNIKYDNGVISMKKGETILIPADLKSLTLIPEQYTELLEVYIEDFNN
jgi:mannose-6-phosphate isomerase